MINEVFAAALAQVLAERDGLSVAYFPDGADDAAAIAMVKEANRRRPEREPFSILIRESDLDLLDETCLQVSPQTALKYRLDNRLAVVVGRPPELASFVTTFSEGLSQTFPEGATGVAQIRRIAKALLPEVLHRAGVDLDPNWDRQTTEELLENALLQLREVHSSAGQRTVNWTTNWFEHVRFGSSALVEVLRDEAERAPSRSAESAFREFTYASFGLPAPFDSTRLGGSAASVGAKVNDALEQWWSDKATIEASISLLEKNEVDPHPLRSVR